MDKPIVLICGDSLALPRGDLSYAGTWPAILQAELKFPVVNRSQYSATTKKLAAPDMLEYYHPAYVILQLGVCDAAPRLFSLKSKRFLSAMPELLQNQIIKAVKRNTERDTQNVLVPIVEFRKNIADYIERGRGIGVKAIMMIKILRPGDKYTAKNPAAGANFIQYNKVIEDISRENADIVQCIDPVGMDDDVDALTIEDGYHLNRKGHELIAARVIALMNNRGMR